MPIASTALPPETSARACRRFLTTALDERAADAFTDDGDGRTVRFELEA